MSKSSTPVSQQKFAIYFILAIIFAGFFTLIHNYLRFAPLNGQKITADGFSTSVETTEKPQLSAEKRTVSTLAATRKTTSGTTVKATASTTSALKTSSSNSITIGGKTSAIFTASVGSNGLLPDAGNSVGYFNKSFLYGHSTRAFNNLASIGEGAQFTATLDGKTATYLVVKRAIYDYATANNVRRNLFNSMDAEGTKYALALMTCAGSYNSALGTYDHRLMLFAIRLDQNLD